MKKETLKEFGKLNYDIAKILIATVIIGGFIKNEKGYETIIVPIIFVTLGLIIMGTILINKGAKDDSE